MKPDIQSLPLRDIHLPDTVAWWPLAPGWWILLALVVLAIATVYLYKLWHYKRRMLQEAEQELSQLAEAFQAHQDARQTIELLSALLRRVGIVAFPQHDVAGLTGIAWLEFLDHTLAGSSTAVSRRFDNELGRYLITAPYAQRVEIDAAQMQTLIALCRQWLRHVSKAASANRALVAADEGAR